MMMSPGFRKFTFTTHITSSVGWIGAVLAFLAVAIIGVTLFATVILLIDMETFRQMAGVAADPVANLATVRNASPVLHAILALILLLAATVLGVYKPFGMTDYGRRTYQEAREGTSLNILGPAATVRAVEAGVTPAWIYVVGVLIIALALLFIALHLTGTSLTHH